MINYIILCLKIRNIPTIQFSNYSRHTIIYEYKSLFVEFSSTCFSRPTNKHNMHSCIYTRMNEYNITKETIFSSYYYFRNERRNPLNNCIVYTYNRMKWKNKKLKNRTTKIKSICKFTPTRLHVCSTAAWIHKGINILACNLMLTREMHWI